MSSWTDLKLTDSLKAACADVKKKTEDDFGAFVKDALTTFGVEKIEELNRAQRKHLEEHILTHWKGFHLTEDKNPQKVDSNGRTTVKENTTDAAKSLATHDDHRGNEGGEHEADKINKITAANSTPVAGKVVAEPGVKTAAQATLSPEERSRVIETAKKLGLYSESASGSHDFRHAHGAEDADMTAGQRPEHHVAAFKYKGGMTHDDVNHFHDNMHAAGFKHGKHYTVGYERGDKYEHGDGPGHVISHSAEVTNHPHYRAAVHKHAIGWMKKGVKKPE